MGNSNEIKLPLPGWGNRLTRARKFLKKTQADAGDALGVRNTAISKWEAENTEGIDERSLIALEVSLGIRREWILYGEEPMTSSTWNRDSIKGVLDEVAGAKLDGLARIPSHAGLAPFFHGGEVIFWTAIEVPTKGDFVLAAPIGAHSLEQGFAPEGTKIGQAFQAEEDWLLYRPEDRNNPGSYPPISLKGLKVFGKIVARATPVNATTLALLA